MAVPTRQRSSDIDTPAAQLAPTAAPAASGWPRRLIIATAVVAAVVLGLVLFSGGFPQSWVVDAARPFRAFQDWVIDNPTNPLFANFLSRSDTA